MAYAFVRSTISPTLASSVAPVYGGTPTAGNLLLASASNQTNTTPLSCSDTNGNWTLLSSSTPQARWLGLFGLIAVASQPTTVTVSGATNVAANIYEFSGNLPTLTGIVAETTPSTQNGTTNTASTAISSTAGFAGSMIFAQLMVFGGTITAPDYVNDTPAFTAGQAGPAGIRLVDYYYLTAAIGDTYGGNYTWTTTRAWGTAHTEFVNKRPGFF